MNEKSYQLTSESQPKSASLQLGRLFLQIRRLERDPLLMKELANRLSITKGAVTQIVKRLETKKLVQRTSHPEDSRAIIVSLTEKGKKAYKAHEELHVNFFKELSTQLSQKEIDIFVRSMDKLVEFLQK